MSRRPLTRGLNALSRHDHRHLVTETQLVIYTVSQKVFHLLTLCNFLLRHSVQTGLKAQANRGLYTEGLFQTVTTLGIIIGGCSVGQKSIKAEAVCRHYLQMTYCPQKPSKFETVRLTDNTHS